EVKETLRGIQCRGGTSCPDQLAQAIDAYEARQA
ncbi:MAG: TSCPD domain-containing protein, partial [Clostridia bacterium]|nr:TSCPD domain-containing protein [Clostridia bacterium]